MSELRKSGITATPSPRTKLNLPQMADVRSYQRKPAPSPLQVTQTVTPLIDSFIHDSPQGLGFPLSPRAASSPSYSPRSPRYNPAFTKEPNKSPRERLNESLATERSSESSESSRQESPLAIHGKALTTPKEDTFRQVHNASSPNLSTNPGGPSFAASSSDTTTSTTKDESSQLESRLVPRTSSIDSTMSTISSTTSQSYQSAQDLMPISPGDIQHIISLAGSPEAAIQQLIREKRQAATQNAQLWRLVDKQRVLVLGLNKDLERALQDKEKCRKKLKEQLVHSMPVLDSASKVHTDPVRVASVSPTLSDSQDELPIQRHSLQDEFPDKAQVIQDVHNLRHGGSNGVISPARVTHARQTPSQDLKFRSGAMGSGRDRLEDDEISPGTVEISGAGIRTSAQSSPNMRSPRQSRELETISSHSSFTARRSLTAPRKAQPSPLIDTAPSSEDQDKAPISARKPPPAPLNLALPKKLDNPPGQCDPVDHSGSDYDEVDEVDEIPAFERGRKKTREEDDREREVLALKERASISRAKKINRSKSAVEQSEKNALPASQDFPRSPVMRAFSPTFPGVSVHGHLAPPASLAGVLSLPSSSDRKSSILEHSIISPSLLSPGLPLSPRPSDRPVNAFPPRLPREGADIVMTSPPISPRAGRPGMSLSPRAPRHAIPLPPHTPTSLISPLHPEETQQPIIHTSPVSSDASDDILTQSSSHPEEERECKVLDAAEVFQVGSVYKGLVSESYSGLLLPPNALPCVFVKVISSRLKPSRHSTLAVKGPEEESVFTLGIFLRADLRQLWQVEKPALSLPQLDHQLKQVSSFNAKIPERGLFSGHAPAKIDARRIALEKYFESIFDTPIEEKAGLVMCRYLSTHVIQLNNDIETGDDGKSDRSDAVSLVPTGRKIKEGYLTKRGKTFGGWKARYFVLDEPILRYYESKGGALVGSIRIQHAQIGRQTVQHPTPSPSRGSEEIDDNFRHAFLILEPKRKDSSNHLRHVLCAESDEERDQWVASLIQYVDTPSSIDKKVRPQLPRNESSSSKLSLLLPKKKSSKSDEFGNDTPENDANSLHAVSYETTIQAQAPHRVTPTPRDTETPSPEHDGHAVQISKSISGPLNGIVIQNATAWGNRPLDSPRSKDKERKRSIWGFREKAPAEVITSHSNDSVVPLARPHPNGQHKDVFGIPLAEAVESCPPRGVDACLPAVVYRCLEYLAVKEAASEEGIFRLSGSNLVIKALRERFHQEGDVDICADGHYYDVHAVASLLKQYLRELPTPILTRDLHLDFLSVLELEDKDKKLAAYNMLVHRLPLPNWTLLRALSAFLIEVVGKSDVNKMNIRNVGIVFAPTLNIPAPVFASFLTEFDLIFSAEPDKASMKIEVPAAEPLTPEDIRSPRRQIFSDIPTPSYQQDTFPGHDSSVNYEDVLWNFPSATGAASTQLRDPSPAPAPYETSTLGARPFNQGRSASIATGFIPLQPTYETLESGARFSNKISTVPAPPESTPFRPAYETVTTGTKPTTHAHPPQTHPTPFVALGPGSNIFQRTLGSTGIMRDSKARRRESSMLSADQPSHGQRKLSLPFLRHNSHAFTTDIDPMPEEP